MDIEAIEQTLDEPDGRSADAVLLLLPPFFSRPTLSNCIFMQFSQRRRTGILVRCSKSISNSIAEGATAVSVDFVVSMTRAMSDRADGPRKVCD